MGEAHEYKLIKRIIQLIKEGPAINFCQFSKKVYFYATSLLRAFLGYCVQTKKLIM